MHQKPGWLETLVLKISDIKLLSDSDLVWQIQLTRKLKILSPTTRFFYQMQVLIDFAKPNLRLEYIVNFLVL